MYTEHLFRPRAKAGYEDFSRYAPGSRGLRSQSATDVPVQTNTPTLPGPPPGFNQINLWSFPDFFTIPSNAVIDSLDLTFDSPVQISADTFTNLFNFIQQQALGQGYDVLAYEVDEMPGVTVTVPSEVCFGQTNPPTCIGVPGQICLCPPILCPPNGSLCVPISGDTVTVGATYRLWLLVEQPGANAARASVRAFLPIAGAIAIVILILGVIAAVVLIRSIQTGTLTPTSFAQFVTDLFKAPGNALTPLIQNAEWPLIALGAVAIVAGVGIPALTLGGGATLPGGLGGNANFGIGASGGKK